MTESDHSKSFVLQLPKEVLDKLSITLTISKELGKNPEAQNDSVLIRKEREFMTKASLFSDRRKIDFLPPSLYV